MFGWAGDSNLAGILNQLIKGLKAKYDTKFVTLKLKVLGILA